MPNLLPAVLLHDQYWAINPKAGEVILAQLRATDAVKHRQEYEEAQAARASVGEYKEDKPYQMYGTTAIISISGPMTKKGSSFGSGGTIETRNLLRKAVSDGDVKSILLLWDSPGGSVSGTEDLANEIYSASRKKTVCSYYEDQCCSAALWCGSQAGMVYANSTSIVGSIGVFSYAVDMSRYAENAGITVHLLSTGRHKGAGAIDGVPIDDDQLEEMQRTIDTLGEHFFNAIAKGRNMSRADVDAIADGRVWVGDEAVAVGLVDEIASLDDVLIALQRAQPKRSAVAAETNYDFAAELPLRIDGPLGQALDSVPTAVRGVTDGVQMLAGRIADIKGLRAGQNRPYSQKTLEQIVAAEDALSGMLASLTRLREECAALGTSNGTPATAEEAAEPEDDTSHNDLAELRSRLSARLEQVIVATS